MYRAINFDSDIVTRPEDGPWGLYILEPGDSTRYMIEVRRLPQETSRALFWGSQEVLSITLFGANGRSGHAALVGVEPGIRIESYDLQFEGRSGASMAPTTHRAILAVSNYAIGIPIEDNCAAGPWPIGAFGVQQQPTETR